jgi:hypothetical protein
MGALEAWGGHLSVALTTEDDEGETGEENDSDEAGEDEEEAKARVEPPGRRKQV